MANRAFEPAPPPPPRLPTPHLDLDEKESARLEELLCGRSEVAVRLVTEAVERARERMSTRPLRDLLGYQVRDPPLPPPAPSDADLVAEMLAATRPVAEDRFVD